MEHLTLTDRKIILVSHIQRIDHVPLIGAAISNV